MQGSCSWSPAKGVLQFHLAKSLNNALMLCFGEIGQDFKAHICVVSNDVLHTDSQAQNTILN